MKQSSCACHDGIWGRMSVTSHICKQALMEVGNHALFPGCFTSGTHRTVPKLWWENGIDHDIWILGKKVALDWDEWAKLLKKARAHQGLSSRWWWWWWPWWLIELGWPGWCTRIATCYWLDSTGIESWLGQRFSVPVWPARGPSGLLYNRYWVLPWGKKYRAQWWPPTPF